MKVNKMKAIKLLNIIWDWKSLPSNLQSWLFGTATRTVEVLAGFTLGSMTLLFILEPRTAYIRPVYEHFRMLSPTTWVIAMLFALLGIIFTIGSHSNKSQMINGWFLIFSGLIFMLVGIAYSLSFPPFAPSMIFFPALAVLCVLAGNNKMGLIKEKIHREE